MMVTSHFDFSFAFWGFQIKIIFSALLLHATMTLLYVKYKERIISEKTCKMKREMDLSFS